MTPPMPEIAFYSIIFLIISLFGTILAIICLTVSHRIKIADLMEVLKEKEESLQRLQIRLACPPVESKPEPKLKRYYFTTEQSLELARLYDQTNDRTKDSEAMALLWKRIEQIRPEAAYPSAFLGTDDPIRFYLEWDEDDRDPLKEQK